MSVRYQIAADLHDDLGSTLSSISILSSVLLQQIANEQPPREVIDKIFENAQNALKSIDDIIWSVNPKNNMFSNLFLRIKDYAIPLFESKHIEFEIQIPDSVNSLPLTLEVGRNSYLIIKESVNNLVKHSKCTKTYINVIDRHPYIEIEISDNGVGFIEQQNSLHNGVFNMYERARQIDAQFSIVSNPGAGTIIRLRVKSY
jgi:signal transduction histidine kinase